MPLGEVLMRKTRLATISTNPSNVKARDKRKKAPSLAKLKKKLWKVFSLYIRRRDNYTCVTCGRKGSGSGIHGGHYIVARACGLDYYFSETNVHAQCYHCNINLSGNSHRYREFMVRQYGEKTLKDLETNYWKPCHWAPEDFEKKIAHYEALI